MKFKLSAKNLMVIISSLVSAWVVYLSFTQTPDVILFKVFDYSCGINITTGAYAKLLMIGCWLLTIMITSIMEEQNRENA